MKQRKFNQSSQYKCPSKSRNGKSGRTKLKERPASEDALAMVSAVEASSNRALTHCDGRMPSNAATRPGQPSRHAVNASKARKHQRSTGVGAVPTLPLPATASNMHPKWRIRQLLLPFDGAPVVESTQLLKGPDAQ